MCVCVCVWGCDAQRSCRPNIYLLSQFLPNMHEHDIILTFGIVTLSCFDFFFFCLSNLVEQNIKNFKGTHHSPYNTCQ